MDTPEALKAKIGKDRVQIQTGDDHAAIAALASVSASRRRWPRARSRFGVPEGEQFVPRLFAELGQPISSVSVSRPSLDDVFMSYTGTTIRDAEASQTDTRRNVRTDDGSLMAAEMHTGLPAQAVTRPGATPPGSPHQIAGVRVPTRSAGSSCGR